MSAEFDAVVIGGGIAGCSAAITLAGGGARVALVEAKAYPHHKVCGEVLSPGCIPLLDSLGVMPTIQALAPPTIRRARICAPSGTHWETDFPGEALGLSRYAFDQALAARARAVGVEVFERTSVIGVEGNLQARFTLVTRSDGAQKLLHTRVVIGAHGKRGTLDRVLMRDFLRKPQPFMGFKAHFRGVSIPNRVDLHTFPGGYCGLSDVEDGLINVCFLVEQDAFMRQSGGEVAQFVGWMGRQDAALGAWFAAAENCFDSWLSISQIPFVTKSVIEHDVLMTGDAAGLIAPLAGDGMEMALRGGRMAADAAARFLNGEWSAAALRGGYEALWRQTFASRLRLARALQWIMLRPKALRFGLSALAALPPLGDLIVRHTRDPQFGVLR